MGYSNAAPHRRRDPARITKYLLASGSDPKLSSRATTSSWQRVGYSRRNQTLLLQPLKGRIHGTDGVIVPRTRGDVVTDGKTVSRLPETRDSEQNRKF